MVDADRVPLVQMLGEAATTQTREEPVGAAPTAAADAAESGAERASVEEVVEDVEDDVDAAVPDVDDAFVVVKREAIELGDERDAIILDAAATPCDPMDADETRAEARGGPRGGGGGGGGGAEKRTFVLRARATELRGRRDFGFPLHLREGRAGGRRLVHGQTARDFAQP